jgi:hypothetical protein
MRTPGATAHQAALALFIALFPAARAPAQDLWITPADQDDIRVNVLADPQCPITCGDEVTPCCQTFASIVEFMNSRVPDLTMLNGDLVIDSHDPQYVDQFLGLWDQILGEKHFVLGNHEADPHENFTWADPNDHWVPAVQHEPLFRHGTPEYRRYYSIYIGNPPRVAIFGLNNCSDSFFDDDACYLFCTVPNDWLNHAGSPQRTWLNEQIDALPSTIDAVLVCLHRTYYGVENYLCRPNVLHSAADFYDPPAETLRTGAVSFLRDLESIPDRTNVQRVIVASGDQHCFAITHPILRNVRDDEHGIPYIVLGGAGARNRRSATYPNLNKVPAGVYIDGFDDKWFSTSFRFTEDEIAFTVHEAYTDSLLFETSWPLLQPTGAGELEDAAVELEIEAFPNPVSKRGPATATIQLSVPGGSMQLDRLAIVDVTGRRVKRWIRRPETVHDGTTKTWNLRDEGGNRVAAGVYMVVARIGQSVLTKKIVVLD